MWMWILLAGAVLWAVGMALLTLLFISLTAMGVDLSIMGIISAGLVLLPLTIISSVIAVRFLTKQEDSFKSEDYGINDPNHFDLLVEERRIRRPKNNSTDHWKMMLMTLWEDHPDIYHNLKDRKDAMPSHRDVIDINPENPLALYHLGPEKFRVGMKSLQIGYYTKQGKEKSLDHASGLLWTDFVDKNVLYNLRKYGRKSIPEWLWRAFTKS